MDYFGKKGIFSDQLLDHILDQGSCAGFPGLDEKITRLLLTAGEIAPEWHLKHQAAFQSHTDNAVSKTINLPVEANISDVDRIFRQAWDLGLKGITIFRTGTGKEQFLHPGLPSRRKSFRC
jgi:ribonucleoside-diphosphate reductase alpha chain